MLKRLNNKMLNVKGLTTDRHKQILAYLRKERSEVEYQYNVWHVGKNIEKNSLKIAVTLMNGLKLLYKSLLGVLCDLRR